jgi:hypothetical protein
LTARSGLGSEGQPRVVLGADGADSVTVNSKEHEFFKKKSQLTFGYLDEDLRGKKMSADLFVLRMTNMSTSIKTRTQVSGLFSS